MAKYVLVDTLNMFMRAKHVGGAPGYRYAYRYGYAYYV